MRRLLGAAAVLLATPALAGAATPGSDGVIRGDWATDPGTASGVTAAVLDVSAEVRDVVRDVRSIDGSFGVATGGTSTTVTLQADVLFAFDKADLTPRARARLDQVVQELRAGRARGTVVIGGHADGKGSATYNQGLSERRARAVATALTPLIRGLDVTLQPRGYGDTRPVAPNTKPDGSDNPAGRAKNRRVTVTFTPPRSP